MMTFFEVTPSGKTALVLVHAATCVGGPCYGSKCAATTPYVMPLRSLAGALPLTAADVEGRRLTWAKLGTPATLADVEEAFAKVHRAHADVMAFVEAHMPLTDASFAHVLEDSAWRNNDDTLIDVPSYLSAVDDPAICQHIPLLLHSAIRRAGWFARV
jgi:hypothetical protein